MAKFIIQRNSSYGNFNWWDDWEEYKTLKEARNEIEEMKKLSKAMKLRFRIVKQEVVK